MVEPATIEDFDVIAALNGTAYRELADRMTPQGWLAMKASLRDVAERARTARFLVARAAGEICGSVAYCSAGEADPSIFPREWAAILLLAVAPSCRGGGIAGELVDACLALARRDGAAAVGLFTSELVMAAQRLYESIGFRRESEIAPRNGLRYFRYQLDLA